ncbi:MAG TPA: ATP synthase F1 subunit delta [Gemmatimonadetes bacterium]|nr:ATP synthase F1 subunit delta [Gemmatimonadota bacterium]HIC63383.1 ATP synthase F1 subunit delta [Gemmatimonadota bacterium]
MRDETVARNYAETLFELASRNESIQEYGDALGMVAGLLEDDSRFRTFVETPRIDDETKKDVIRKVFRDKAPKQVINFVLITIDKRRQTLLREISAEYLLLLDDHLGREHVEVTVARPLDDTTENVVSERLSKMLGKQAIPHIRVKPEILGGLVVRTGDMIYDGSVRRRLEDLRRRLLTARIPSGQVGEAAG